MTKLTGYEVEHDIDRGAPEWREPGVAWFEAYQETLREQLEANDEEAP